MKTSKRFLSFMVAMLMMVSMLAVNAGAFYTDRSSTAESASEIQTEQILSPADEYVSSDATVLFSAAMQGGSKIRFLLDGTELQEFDVTDPGTMQTYSANIKLIDEIWGYRTFTVEKYDDEGNLLSSIDKFVKLTTSNYEFMELYRAKSGESYITGYDVRITSDGVTKYGYPRDGKKTAEYAGGDNPYVFGLTTGLTNGTIAYHDDDGDGKKDSIKATYKTNSSSYTAHYKNYIQVFQASSNLLNEGGIIEINFRLKLSDTGDARVTLMGLPGWRSDNNIKNNPSALYPCIIVNGNHYFTEDGSAKAFSDSGIDPKEWNTYKLQYDIDNEIWHFWINEGEANEYTASANKNSTDAKFTGDHASAKVWFNGSKGIFLGHNMYPGKELNGGFAAKDFRVTRYNAAPQLNEILVDGAPIAGGRFGFNATTISGSFTSAYDSISADDASFKINDAEKTGGELSVSPDKMSFTYTLPADVEIKANDKVSFCIKGTAIANGIQLGLNQGFVAKGADPLLTSVDAQIDANEDATLNIEINRAWLTPDKDNPLAILCIYDKSTGNLIDVESAFISGSTAALTIPYSRIGAVIDSFISTLYITEGSSAPTDGDYLNIRLYEPIKWNR